MSRAPGTRSFRRFVWPWCAARICRRQANLQMRLLLWSSEKLGSASTTLEELLDIFGEEINRNSPEVKQVGQGELAFAGRQI